MTQYKEQTKYGDWEVRKFSRKREVKTYYITQIIYYFIIFPISPEELSKVIFFGLYIKANNCLTSAPECPLTHVESSNKEKEK